MEVKAIESIKVFPNPAKDRLSVSWDAGELMIQQIQIIDIAGKRVLTQKVSGENSGSFSVEVSHLPEGQYIINVEGTSGEFWQQKIIIE